MNSLISEQETPARVLIVDDELANRKLMKRLVSWVGHEPFLAEGGEAALGLLEEVRIDVVLLDLMMPEVDGFAVLDRLKERGLLPDLPVIVVTALGDRDTQIEALSGGALDFLVKPFNRHELACRLNNLARLKKAQDALKVRQGQLEGMVQRRTRQFQTLLETAPDLIFTVTRDGVVEYQNRGDKTLVGQNLCDFASDSSRAKVLEMLRLAAESDEVLDFEIEANLVEKYPCTYQARLRRLPQSQQREARILVFATDITERLRAESSLRDTMRRVELIQQHQPLFLYELQFTEGSTYPTWSSGDVEAILGFQPAISDSIESLFDQIHPEDRENLRSFVRELQVDKPSSWTFEHRLRAPGGGVKWMLHFGMTVYNEIAGNWRAIGWALDITRLRQLEGSLSQKQKMEALGQLAGGVAHDFNNLLTVILAHANFLEETVPAGSDLREDVTAILESAGRASGLTRQLLAFSRNQPLRLQPLDLNRSVRQMESLLQRTLGGGVELKVRTQNPSAVVLADSTKIDQVLLNLAVNARDAMPEGGVLEIELSESQEPGRGKRVVLTVTDTGQGMSEETQRRIFQPFFTTKEDGKGTGLGLATCYGIISHLHGEIAVESELGKGTSFIVKLPAHAGTRNQSPTPGA